MTLRLTAESQVALPLYSRLRRLIETSGLEQAPAAHWQGWLRGQLKHGLSAVELEYSGVEAWLQGREGRVGRNDLLGHIHALPSDVQVHLLRRRHRPELEFENVRKTDAELRKLQPARSPHDPLPFVSLRNAAYDFNVVRYWERDLFGLHDTWRVVDGQGRLWRSHLAPAVEPPVFRTRLEALAWCRDVATRIIPEARGRPGYAQDWRHVRLNVGSDYREWLICLPHAGMYQVWSRRDHFKVDRLLMHLRTSVHECEAGQFLLVEEIQSDRNQHISQVVRTLRKAIKGAVPNSIQDNPFLKGWVELGLRVALLLACQQGLAGVAISTGDMQDMVYDQENAGRRQFYDVLLKRALAKLADDIGAGITETSVEGNTQHTQPVREEFTAANGDRRHRWRLRHLYSNELLPPVYDSYRDAVYARDYCIETRFRAAVPLLSMSAETRERILQAGLPSLGAVQLDSPRHTSTS